MSTSIKSRIWIYKNLFYHKRRSVRL